MGSHFRKGSVFCLALIGFAQTGAAQTIPDTPAEVAVILTIDRDILFSNSLFGQRVQREAKEAGRILTDENRRIQKALEAEELDLTKLRRSISPEEFSPMADEFDSRVQEIRIAQDQKSRDISRRVEIARQEFTQMLLSVLSEISIERRAVAILDKDTVFLSAGKIDITDEAVRRIDAAIGDGSDGAAADSQPSVPAD
ncbi:MAG: OmpH family outer membrane protein [Pseudoruegeria sp.]